MQLILVSVEFAERQSGNGVLAQTMAAALLAAGHELLVVAAHHRPTPLPEPLTGHPRLYLASLQMSSYDRALTREGCWQAFADAVASEGPFAISTTGLPPDFHPDIVLHVDWSAHMACDALLRLPRFAVSGQSPPKRVYLCFRVFCQSHELLHGNADALEFYRTHEARAVAGACAVVALSEMDSRALQELFETRSCPPFRVLWPPLRDEIALLAQVAPQLDFTSRPYIACCTRLSPEKAPIRFARLIQRLGADFLAAHNLTPLLCGAAADAQYAAAVRQELLAACPSSVIVDKFLDAAGLASLLQQSRLNIHPSQNDAFGMTIVEAAAFGTPSVISDDGSVGAVHIFSSSPEDCLVLADVGDEEALAASVRRALEQPHTLAEKGHAAQKLALKWNQAAFGAELDRLLCSGFAESM